MPHGLGRLVKLVVGSFPVQNPHPEQRQEDRIIDLGPIHLMKPFGPVDNVGPESIVKEQIWVYISPPPIMGSNVILPSS